VNKVEVVVTVIKIATLTLIPLVFVIYGGKYGFPIDYTVTLSGILSVIPSTMWMYLGVESCSIVGSKGAKPVILGILSVGSIYALNILGLLMTINSQTNSAAPHAEVVGQICDRWCPFLSFGAENFIAICIIIICAGSINSWFVFSARSFQAIQTPKCIQKDYFSAVIWSTIGLFPLAWVVSSPNMKATYDQAFSCAGVVMNVFYLLCIYSITCKYRCYRIGIACGIVLIGFLIYSVWSLIAPLLA
jgi:hypothetical protein